MPVKIRLARQGKKSYAHYAIVVADSRASRDGRFIEKLGTFNPNLKPAQIDINFDRALYWIQTGAQPTDTCKTILSTKGVLLKDHLLRGVKKGAFDEAAANAKFDQWLQSKVSKINAEKESAESSKKSAAAKRLEAETKIKEAKAEILAKKKAEAEAALKAMAAEATAAVEAASSETPAAEQSAE